MKCFPILVTGHSYITNKNSVLMDVITSIARLPLGNENIVFVKIFNIKFSPDLYILSSLEPKKVVFGNSSVVSTL